MRTRGASSHPFLDYSPEIRRVIYSTAAIESLHAGVRRRARWAELTVLDERPVTGIEVLRTALE